MLEMTDFVTFMTFFCQREAATLLVYSNFPYIGAQGCRLGWNRKKGLEAWGPTLNCD